MVIGAKMSNIRAWLDDRGKPYSQIDNTLRIRYGWHSDKHIFVEFKDGVYVADGKPYKSQRAVINEVLNPFYGNPYKEV